MLITGSGPIVILTSHDSVVDAALINKLAGKGIEKFIAYEIPIGLAQHRYGAHFALVQGDVRKADDLRFLEIFKSDHYADVSLDQWLALTPPELVSAHLRSDPQFIRALRKDKMPVVPA